MNIEEIEQFIGKSTAAAGVQLVTITFKKRDAIQGFLVKGTDYNDLKSKNFWRVVKEKDLDAWQKSKNVDLAKIFSGSEFSRLKYN
jgi:hypothetical protein